MPQLLIESESVPGCLVGGALAIYILARAFRLVAPLISKKVARNLAISRGPRSSAP